MGNQLEVLIWTKNNIGGSYEVNKGYQAAITS